MTKYAKLSNKHLSSRKQASAPKVRTWQSWLSNRPLVNSVLLTVLIGFGVTYLGVMNSTAADTFKVHELSVRIDDSKEQARDLDLQVSEVLSLQHIDSMSEQYDLVSVSSAQYLDTNSAVALR